MKVFKLTKYAEDGVLTDVDDADFLGRKIGDENQLDFSGVISVSSAFLDHLLSGQTLDSLDGRILGQTDDVDRELVAWIDRQEKVSSKKKAKTKG